jgi:UDP-N-acetylmuramate dehydrogenase
VTLPGSINVERDVSLAPLTTLKVGGAASFFVRATSEAEIIAAFDYAKSNGLDVFVLGGGSNILVSDDGFDGLVIQVALKGIDHSDDFVTARAGEDWDHFVSFCVDEGLAGVECLSGIPGFVGGTPVQNVGAYGQEVSETIVSVRCYDRSSGTLVELANAECGFSYRKSIFNSSHLDRYVVLSVKYRLIPGGEPKIVYKDLREHFGDTRPGLAEARAAVLAIRRAKSMVIDEADPNSRSAGSFFKNPIVESARLDEIAARADGRAVPSFPAAEGRVKVPAAWLIENAGFHKGFRLGRAGISSNHSLAIVNLGGAAASDILALKERIQDGVLHRFDIMLEPEPIFVGFS